MFLYILKSAGVGRTGTFIAVDYLMQHVRTSDVIDIYSYVMKMRNNRPNMVQTEVIMLLKTVIVYYNHHKCIILLMRLAFFIIYFFYLLLSFFLGGGGISYYDQYIIVVINM